MKVFYIGIMTFLVGIFLWLMEIYPLGTGLILAGSLLLISYTYCARKPKTETITLLAGICSWFISRFYLSRGI